MLYCSSECGAISHWTKNRICPKFAWCKYVANMKFAKLCNQCKGGDGRIRTKASKFGRHHTCTGCKAHLCNVFAQGKFYANSFFRPVSIMHELRKLPGKLHRVTGPLAHHVVLHHTFELLINTTFQ